MRRRRHHGVLNGWTPFQFPPSTCVRATGQQGKQVSLCPTNRGRRGRTTSKALPHSLLATPFDIHNATLLSALCAQPVEEWRDGRAHLLWRISGEGEVALAALPAASSGNSARPLSVGGQSSQAPPPMMQPGRILVDDFLTYGINFMWFALTESSL